MSRVWERKSKEYMKCGCMVNIWQVAMVAISTS